MSTTQVSSLTQGTWPTCLILPSKTGSSANCYQIQMPSVPTIILILIISWIIFMIVAYIIYYFLNKVNRNMNYSYWVILLLLIVAGIIVSFFTKFF
jgi:hypothetical protein